MRFPKRSREKSGGRRSPAPWQITLPSGSKSQFFNILVRFCGRPLMPMGYDEADTRTEPPFFDKAEYLYCQALVSTYFHAALLRWQRWLPKWVRFHKSLL